jgi:hypothetical protein
MMDTDEKPNSNSGRTFGGTDALTSTKVIRAKH